jgi:hypothetical protein
MHLLHFKVSISTLFSKEILPAAFRVKRQAPIGPFVFHSLSQLFINAHDEPLSVALCVFALSALVENGHNG